MAVGVAIAAFYMMAAGHQRWTRKENKKERSYIKRNYSDIIRLLDGAKNDDIITLIKKVELLNKFKQEWRDFPVRDGQKKIMEWRDICIKKGLSQEETEYCIQALKHLELYPNSGGKKDLNDNINQIFSKYEDEDKKNA